MEEPADIRCPSCDSSFYVVWNLSPVYLRPEYCPFCGDEIDYEAQWQEARKENE